MIHYTSLTSTVNMYIRKIGDAYINPFKYELTNASIQCEKGLIRLEEIQYFS